MAAGEKVPNSKSQIPKNRAAIIALWNLDFGTWNFHRKRSSEKLLKWLLG